MWHWVGRAVFRGRNVKAAPRDFYLVVTDMSMPEMPGDRLAEKMLLIRPDTPVIICTGFSERIDPERADAIGVRGLLIKPVKKVDMGTMVRSVLDYPECCPECLKK